jgi:hypothetical protein
MAYEVTCPSCGAHLNIRDDAGEAALICPRCLSQVPNPHAAASPATAAAPVTGITAQPRRTVPSVEAETKTAVFSGYFVVLALTLLAMVGTILAFRIGLQQNRQGQHAVDPSVWVLVLLGLEVVLTILLLQPIGRWLFRGRKLRMVGSIAVLLVLAPVAFLVVFLAVCAVCVAVSSNVM